MNNLLDPEIDIKVMKLVNSLNYSQLVKKIMFPKKANLIYKRNMENK